MAENMNIYQKLIEVRKTIEYLKKDNQGYQFKFVSSSQTLASVRKALDEHGLLLIPRVIGTETRDHTTSKGKHEYFTLLDMEFTWVDADNPSDKIVCGWVGQGLDDGEKGVGKALTYAEKYFILKSFNIPTDKDDPDSFQERQGKSSSKTDNDAQGAMGDDGASDKTDTKPPPKPASQPQSVDTGDHYCPVHKTNFFMRGKMKDFAHPYEENGTTKWCNEADMIARQNESDPNDLQACDNCKVTAPLHSSGGIMVCDECDPSEIDWESLQGK